MRISFQVFCSLYYSSNDLFSAAIGRIIFLRINLLFYFILGRLPDAMLFQPGDQPLAKNFGYTKCCQQRADDLYCHECISYDFNYHALTLKYSIAETIASFNDFPTSKSGFPLPVRASVWLTDFPMLIAQLEYLSCGQLSVGKARTEDIGQ